METIVVEREYDQPLTADRLHAAAADARWCLENNRVNALYSYLAGDGRRLFCVFRAPDAESVRRSLRQLEGSHPNRAWTAALIEPPSTGATAARPPALALVERSWDEPVAFEEVEALEESGASCLELHRVRFLRTYFSNDRRRMLCLYAAPDAESVRLTQAKIGMPFDDVWPVTLVSHT
jgi:hypothetical protein